MDVIHTSEIVSGENDNSTAMQYTSEKQHRESFQLEASMKAEECLRRALWSDLPSLPLEMIYSLLECEDRVNMSLVCRKWSAGFDSPSVWKTFTFELTESQLSMDICPFMKFAHKYSSVFRHVTVNHELTRDRRAMDNWCKHFIAFLQILENNSQLISVRFAGLPHWIENGNLNFVCATFISRAIANFLGSQHHLQQVELYGCYFKFHEGVELLRKLILSNGNSLRHLSLCRFICYGSMGKAQNSIFEPNLPKITDLPYLQSLDTEYNFIFESMISLRFLRTQITPQKMELSKIILKCENSWLDEYLNKPQQEDFRGLNATDWQFLKKISPNLQVELLIDTHFPSSEELEFFIVPHMPITRLKYRYDVLDTQMDVHELFRHLLACKTNDHLTSLELRMRCPTPDLVSPFIPFLPACKNLKILKIHLYHPSHGLDLMEYWLHNRPEYLQKIIMFITGIEDYGDYIILKNLTSAYVYQLKLLGINLEVEINNEDVELYSE